MDKKLNGEDNIFLLFDTETTGLFHTKDKPKEGIIKARDPMKYPEDYPRVFQLAFILINQEGKILDQFSSFIKPDGWNIPKERSDPDKPNFWEEYGYTDELCEREGVPAIEAFTKFSEAVSKADYLVAHNLGFDRLVMLAELARYKIKVNRKTKPGLLCTMLSSIDFVEAKHSAENIAKWDFLRNKFKYPKLEELHEKLFSYGFDGAHDALNDVKAMFKCMTALFHLGIMSYDKQFVPD